MQILFDELEKDIPADYETVGRSFTIDMSFFSDDPEELTTFVKKKLEKVRTNVVAWRAAENGQISVGVGHFFTDTDFGQPIFPYWWEE